MCRQTYPEVKKLMEESGGKIRLAFRHYPLYRKPEHAMALPVAMVAEYAADKGKFWKFLDLAFAGNSESVQTLDGIYDLAREAGLNYNEVKNLIEGQDEKLLDRVEADIHKANELGIKSTPTYIILAQGLPTRRAVGTQIRTLLSLPEYKRILASDEQKS
jgi:protein-disulfide isomerase